MFRTEGIPRGSDLSCHAGYQLAHQSCGPALGAQQEMLAFFLPFWYEYIVERNSGEQPGRCLGCCGGCTHHGRMRRGVTVQADSESQAAEWSGAPPGGQGSGGYSAAVH
jgi:hypothetical protein